MHSAAGLVLQVYKGKYHEKPVAVKLLISSQAAMASKANPDAAADLVLSVPNPVLEKLQEVGCGQHGQGAARSTPHMALYLLLLTGLQVAGAGWLVPSHFHTRMAQKIRKPNQHKQTVLA
jgi:hypothetical protein